MVHDFQLSSQIHLASPQIIAIANQKGGVGKTTTAINLATALTSIGKKILIIDLDPQGNASTGLGISIKDRKITSYNVLLGSAPLKEGILKTEINNLSLLPACVHLAGAEVELVDMMEREYRLKNAIKNAAYDFDYVFIDCPPALGFLTLNAFVAAHAVLVPLQCEFFALEGINHLMKTIERVKKTFNPDLEIHGVVLTMFDKRNNLSDLVAEDVRSCFGAKVYETMIPRNVRVSEAPSHGKPVLFYDFQCSGSQAYVQLAKEMLQREKNLTERKMVA